MAAMIGLGEQGHVPGLRGAGALAVVEGSAEGTVESAVGAGVALGVAAVERVGEVEVGADVASAGIAAGRGASPHAISVRARMRGRMSVRS